MAAPSLAHPSPIRCPACAEDIRPLPDPHAPVLFVPCGHTVCGLCAEAILALPKSRAPSAPDAAVAPEPTCPQCPICSKAIGHTAPNSALGELAGPCHTVAGDAGPVPSAADHCPLHPDHPLELYCKCEGTVICTKCALEVHKGHEFVTLCMAAEELSTVVTRVVKVCQEGAAVLRDGIPVVADTKAALKQAKAAAIDRLKATIVMLKKELDTHELSMTVQLTAVYDERMKALDAQVVELAVSVDQLQAATALCETARGTMSPLKLAQAVECGEKMSALVKPFEGPVASALVDIVSTPQLVVNAITSLSKLKVKDDAPPPLRSPGPAPGPVAPTPSPVPRVCMPFPWYLSQLVRFVCSCGCPQWFHGRTGDKLIFIKKSGVRRHNPRWDFSSMGNFHAECRCDNYDSLPPYPEEVFIFRCRGHVEKPAGSCWYA